MKDRKTQTILTELVEAEQSIEDMKSTQRSGADSILLSSRSFAGTYDYTNTIPPSGGTNRLDVSVWFYPSSLKPWQPSDYSQLHYKLWLDNMDNPYNGASSQFGVFNMLMDTNDMFNKFTVQMINTGTVERTIFMKFDVVTSARGGSMSWSGELRA